MDNIVFGSSDYSIENNQYGKFLNPPNPLFQRGNGSISTFITLSKGENLTLPLEKEGRGNFKATLRNFRYFLTALIICSCFCSVVSISKATDYYSTENVHKFAEYLYQEGDYVRSAKEYERYLLNSPQETDEVLLRIGLCYRHIGDTQKAIDFFQRITKEYPKSDFKFSANYQISYSYFLSGQYKESTGYIEQVLKETEGEKRQKLEILLALNYLNQRQWRSASNLLNSVNITLEDKVTENIILELKDRSLEGINLKRKSRSLASLMSAILPGTGKIYSKQFGNGIFSFVLVGATGLLAWDGFRENGVKSVKGWIFGSLCSVFYTGNIYGSGISALAYNHQAETDILMRLPSLSDE